MFMQSSPYKLYGSHKEVLFIDNISSPLTNRFHINIFNTFAYTFCFVKDIYGRQVFIEVENKRCTAIYKTFFRMDPIGPFFHEYHLAVRLFPIKSFCQMNCLFSTLRRKAKGALSVVAHA